MEKTKMKLNKQEIKIENICDDIFWDSGKEIAIAHIEYLGEYLKDMGWEIGNFKIDNRYKYYILNYVEQSFKPITIREIMNWEVRE